MFTDYETMSVYTAKAWDSSGFAYSSALHKDVLNSYDKTIYLIGIDFNSEEKNISGFAWEEVE
ncbi:MAG: hypothetical protein U9P37_00360 [Pseudomonadota bacterium]|nr:hypothetical protein [Pseudomonadota bacterium]